MSINYAQLRKQARKSSVNSNFLQYHQLSQDKTFTESFPVSLQRPRNCKQNQLSLLEFDENQMDFKSHPFTFQDKMDHKTEATKKKFVFDDNTQTCKPGEFKNVLAAMDEYIDFLNESSDSFTINTESTSKFELQLFQKLNMIRQKHEGLFQKYKEAQHNYKSQKYQNQLLRQKLSDLHKQFEEEHNDKLRLASSHTKLKSKYKDLLMRSQYLQNSFLKERLKNENHKLFIGRLQQDSPENLETQSQQLTHETHETEEENYVTKFLKSQMRKLKQNNQQIDQYSRVFSKKYSENNNNTTHEEF